MGVARHLEISPWDHLLFWTDADSRLLPGCLAAVSRAFTERSVVASSGPVVAEVRGQSLIYGYWAHRFHLLSFFPRTKELWLLRLFRRGNIFLIGPNTAVRESVFNGVTSEVSSCKVGEDIALTLSVLGCGGRTTYLAEQRVSTSARKFIDEYGRWSWRRFAQYAGGVARPTVNGLVKRLALKYA